MPRIPDSLLESVIYLYPTTATAMAGKRTGGSGFLVAYPSRSRPGNYFVYAVTNRHVIERGESPVVRINSRKGPAVTVGLTFLDWHFHPDGDDVAVSMPPFSADHEYRHAIKLEDFLSSELIDQHNIGPGDDTFMVGRFANHPGSQRNLPTVRFGNIAQMPGDRIDVGGSNSQEAFLIETRSLSGFSGSPVFVHIPMLSYRWQGKAGWSQQAGPWLLGIDCAHMNFEDPLMTAKGQPHPDGWFASGNAGMAVVVPAWRIREFLESPLFALARDAADARASERATSAQPASNHANTVGDKPGVSDA